jgi:hypothetical protein
MWRLMRLNSRFMSLSSRFSLSRSALSSGMTVSVRSMKVCASTQRDLSPRKSSCGNQPRWRASAS